MKKDQTPPTEPKTQKPLNHYLDDFNEIMGTEVTVLEDGKEIVVTRQRAILMRIAADAMSGQPRAIQMVWEYFKVCPIPAEVPFRMTSEARKMLDMFKKDAEAFDYKKFVPSE